MFTLRSTYSNINHAHDHITLRDPTTLTVAGNMLDTLEQTAAEEVSRRFPKEVLWDPLDSRLLVVQASPLSLETKNTRGLLKKPVSSGKGSIC